MAAGPGRDQLEPMARLVRIMAALHDAGTVGVTGTRLVELAGYGGEQDPHSQLARDLKHLRGQGWLIDNVGADGQGARYRMVSGDNRLRLRLSPEQQAALERAVILAEHEDQGVASDVVPHEQTAALNLALQALRLRSRLRFQYKGTPRVVHLAAVRFEHVQWYAAGVEDGDDVLKHYAVSRMSDVALDPPGTAEVTAEVRRIQLHPLLWEVDPPTDVTLRVAPEHVPDVVRWLREPESRTADELTYRVTNRAAFRARLHTLGARVRVVGPQEFRDELLDRAPLPGGAVMATPKFVERVARLPEVLGVLAAYPDGLPLQDLAEQFGVAPDVLREDLVTFMDAESWGWVHDIFRPPVLEFQDDDRVRVVHDTPAATLGVEHLSAGDLATIYTAGLALLDAGRGDEHLADALAVISETMYGEPASQPAPAEWNRLLPLLQQAQAEQRRVDIVYSRAWRIGVLERTIDPLRLQQTKRGWEVDAGPLDAEGRLRTFLLSNIRSADVRAESFEPPHRPRQPAGPAAAYDPRPGGAGPGLALGRRHVRRAGGRGERGRGVVRRRPGPAAARGGAGRAAAPRRRRRGPRPGADRAARRGQPDAPGPARAPRGTTGPHRQLIET